MGVPYSLAADAAGVLCQPFALWASSRLAGVCGHHMAIVISTYVWATMTTEHLGDSTPSPWEAVLWGAVQSAAATGASLLQARIMPASTQPKEWSSCPGAR